MERSWNPWLHNESDSSIFFLNINQFGLNLGLLNEKFLVMEGGWGQILWKSRRIRGVDSGKKELIPQLLKIVKGVGSMRLRLQDSAHLYHERHQCYWATAIAKMSWSSSRFPLRIDCTYRYVVCWNLERQIWERTCPLSTWTSARWSELIGSLKLDNVLVFVQQYLGSRWPMNQLN